MDSQLALLHLILVSLRWAATRQCPNTSAVGDTKPLYLLVLRSFPGGLTAVSGPRIAQDEINNQSDMISD